MAQLDERDMAQLEEPVNSALHFSAIQAFHSRAISLNSTERYT
jgi:hypothetical protein